ncbi:MAG: long-chain fatty acid--CoA ligase [Treponema sp. CETP13]|nr:MAG: long-chain fatty acid--CoA ligase [Treponema sp. CETP13]
MPTKNQKNIPVNSLPETLPKMFSEVAAKYPKIAAQCYKNKNKNYTYISYQDVEQISLDFAAGLLSCGVQRGQLVGLISDSRFEWQHISMGIMTIGAVDVPRGSDANEKDLTFILSFAECETVILENDDQVNKILRIKDSLNNLKIIIVIDSIKEETVKKCEEKKLLVLTYDTILAKGKIFRSQNNNKVEEERSKGHSSDLACVIFTSGTTGQPKGAMLTHGNFITQLDELQERIYLNPGEKALSVLPVWHAFERLCEYVVMIQAATLCYSKPVGQRMLEDFKNLNPQLLPAVPRVFEALYEGIVRAMRKQGGVVYFAFKLFLFIGKLYRRITRILFRRKARIQEDNLILNWMILFIPFILLWPFNKLGDKIVFSKIRDRLGTSFRAGISGGGALPPAVDEFFWAVGICVVEGYGLTETAPVISVRPIKNPIFGTIGAPIRGVEVRVLDNKGRELPAGIQGVIEVRGGTVMKGYYKQPELTSKVINKEGWFNTGDIGLKTINGELILKGRVKDTIVLRGGENVEPLPIEMKLNESRYISQSIVVGQDQRHLAALLVPDEIEIKEYAEKNEISYTTYDELLKTTEIHDLLENEIINLISAKNGFRMFERISHFDCISKKLEIGVELSAKQEIKRYVIRKMYANVIKNLFL